MFASLMRKFPVQQLLRPSATITATAGNATGEHQWRSISTADGSQNAEHITKTVDKVGGLPANLVQQQKMKKAIRALSTLQNHSVPIAARVTVSKDESRDFMAVFPDVVRDLTEAVKKYKVFDVSNALAKALQYNVPRGKKNRGLLTVLTYKSLVKPDQLTPENIRLAQYLGWCIEMLHSFFIIADDIMDNSPTRRGQPSWFKLDNVGLIAVNDLLMIENGIYTLLKERLGHLDCYIDIVELFHEMTLITTCGQSLDLLSSNNNVTSFTMEKYKAIVVNKTAYYTFYLPVALAMHLAGFKDAEAFRQSRMILLEMGHFYQVQDDFLDCFGNPEITGKIGTDIQDNKCSWLAVLCMQRVNDEQKAIMMDCYGQKDLEKVARVKELYKELGIPSTYATYEEESYNMIKTHIQQTSRGVPHEVFLQILNKIYQRDS